MKGFYSFLFTCMLFASHSLSAQDNSSVKMKEMLCSGRWSSLVEEQGGKLLTLSEADQNAYILFKEDGTVISGTIGENEENAEKGEWKLVNNKIIVSLSDDTRIYRFNIKSNKSRYYLYATFDIGDGPTTKVMVRNTNN